MRANVLSTLLPILFAASGIFAQVCTITPDFPTTEDTIVITFNASLGNLSLSGHAGKVYLQTGLITVRSQSIDSKTYVNNVGQWATADTNVLMKGLGNNLFQKKIHIRSYYNVTPNQQVLQMAFTFRNESGSLVGLQSDNTDILIPVNKQPARGYSSHEFDGQKLTVMTDNATLIFEPFTPEIIRVDYFPDHLIEQDSSYVVVLESQNPSVSFNENNDQLHLSTEVVDMIINKSTLCISYLKNGDTLLSDKDGFYHQFENKGVTYNLDPDECIYGTGSRGLPINRKGYSYHSYNIATYDYVGPVRGKNITIPFIASSKLYGVYFDNHTPGYFDIGAFDPSVFNYRTEFSSFTSYFMAADDYQGLMSNYTLLTGRQPLPPRWALGYIQSRYGYHSEQEARNIVNQMRDEGFPMDGLVLDLFWFGGDANMGNLDWDYSSWPDPVGMIGDFDSMGVKLVVITEPFIVETSDNFSYLDQNHMLCTDSAGNSYIMEDFWAGSSALLDLTIPEAQEWMLGYYDARIQEGVSGFWCDLGEPQQQPAGMFHNIGTAHFVHNIYSLIWEEMIYNYYRQSYPETRVLTLPRSGYAGMQRFSTFPWSGDVHRSFDGFRTQISLILGMGMSGVGYMHCDMGGFASGTFDPELYTRWLQFGAFAPVMRAHSQEQVPPEPIFYPEPYKSIVRNYIKLRYRMLPYNYSNAWHNHVKGQPLMLPANFFNQDQQILENLNDEYLWGEDILVAPIMSPGQITRNVVLPPGKWIYYWTNEAYPGLQTISVNAPIEWMPLFIKAGSFLPMVDTLLTTENYSTDSLIVKYFPDYETPESSFTLYDDDGKTPNAFAMEQYDILKFSGSLTLSDLWIQLNREGPGYSGMPEIRKICFEIQRITSEPEEVLKNGAVLTLVSSMEEFLTMSEGAYWDSSGKVLYVLVHMLGQSDEVQIHLIEIANTTEKPTTPGLIDFRLQHPFPNPFSKSTTINIEVYQPGNYQVEIMNLTGQILKRIDFTLNYAGTRQITWNGSDMEGRTVTSGVYCVKVSGMHGPQHTKVVFLN